MLIQEKLGNVYSLPTNNYAVDRLRVEWYETNKRILHKYTTSGIPVTLKFLDKNPDLKDGDILWRNEKTIIVVEINPCGCIVITPRNMLEAFSLCYEIGNRHLPLFYEEEELLVPYEIPLHNLLRASGYEVKAEERKLNNAFRTTVLPHIQVAGSDSIFNKIINLSTS